VGVSFKTACVRIFFWRTPAKVWSNLKKSSHLYKLDPIVIDGHWELHIGGRLHKASLPMESKHQIILPKEDHVTQVIIGDYHRACGHSGREHILASVRRKFWITQGSSNVRKCSRKVCQLPSLPGTTLPTEDGQFNRTSHAGWEATYYISRWGFFWPIPSPSWVDTCKEIWCDLHMSSNLCRAPRNCTWLKHRLFPIDFVTFHCNKMPSEGNLRI